MNNTQVIKSKPKLSLQVDLVFKALFGRDTIESNILLTDLINSVLCLEDVNRINSVTVLNPYTVNQRVDDKLTILDVKAQTCKGELIDIEMQVKYTKEFRNRSLYYWAKLHASQLNSGESYKKLKKSICINIMSENCFEKNLRSHNIFHLLEKDDYFQLTDHLEIHYVQLPLINDTMELDIMDSLTKWMILFKDLHKPEKESIVNKIVSEEGVMQLAYNEYSKITEDDIIREHLEARLKFIRDVNTEKDIAREEGLAEGHTSGLEEGLSKGFTEGKHAVAKELLSILDDQAIEKATGLSLATIKALRDSI